MNCHMFLNSILRQSYDSFNLHAAYFIIVITIFKKNWYIIIISSVITLNHAWYTIHVTVSRNRHTYNFTDMPLNTYIVI